MFFGDCKSSTEVACELLEEGVEPARIFALTVLVI